MVTKICIQIYHFKIKAGEITRWHDFMLVKEKIRFDVRKYSFSKRNIIVWNLLLNLRSPRDDVVRSSFRPSVVCSRLWYVLDRQLLNG